MKKRCLLLCLVLCTESVLFATTTIKGTYLAFKNSEITLNYKKEGLTKQYYSLGTQRCNKEGSFSIDFKLNQVQACYIHLGKYLGVIFAEPNHTYEIDFSILDTAKVNHPLVAFEAPELVVLGIKNQNSTELQYQISFFEQKYQFYQAQVMLNVEESYAQQVVDASIKDLNAVFGEAMKSNVFLNNYIQCNYALLELILPQKRAAIVQDYLNTKIEHQINNPAYWDLMNRLWSTHLDLVGSLELPLYERAILAGDTKALKYIFMNHVGAKNLPWVNDALLVLLYNEKTGHTFPVKTVVSDIVKCKELSSQPAFRLMCEALVKDVSLMLPGSLCPVEALDKYPEGKINLNQFRGKYLLLYFFNPEMSTATSDLNALRTLKQKSQGKLEVVGVICFGDRTAMKNKIDQYKYDLHFATCSDRKMLYQFQLFDLPCIQIFNPQGRVINAKAPTPSGGLTVYLEQQYRKSKPKEKNPFQ